MFVMREAVRSVQRFVTAQAWTGYVLSPTISLETDEEIDAFMRNTTTPLLHPVGTAAMTARSAGYGVVDPDLKVKGVSGLRVVDASVFVSSLIVLYIQSGSCLNITASHSDCPYSGTNVHLGGESLGLDQSRLVMISCDELPANALPITISA